MPLSNGTRQAPLDPRERSNDYRPCAAETCPLMMAASRDGTEATGHNRSRRPVETTAVFCLIVPLANTELVHAVSVFGSTRR